MQLLVIFMPLQTHAKQLPLCCSVFAASRVLVRRQFRGHLKNPISWGAQQIKKAKKGGGLFSFVELVHPSSPVLRYQSSWFPDLRPWPGSYTVGSLVLRHCDLDQLHVSLGLQLAGGRSWDLSVYLHETIPPNKSFCISVYFTASVSLENPNTHILDGIC